MPLYVFTQEGTPPYLSLWDIKEVGGLLLRGARSCEGSRGPLPRANPQTHDGIKYTSPQRQY